MSTVGDLDNFHPSNFRTEIGRRESVEACFAANEFVSALMSFCLDFPRFSSTDQFHFVVVCSADFLSLPLEQSVDFDTMTRNQSIIVVIGMEYGTQLVTCLKCQKWLPELLLTHHGDPGGDVDGIDVVAVDEGVEAAHGGRRVERVLWPGHG